MSPSQDDSVKRNAEIIQTARSVFAEYGFRKVSMDDIAKKLGIARSLLYYYYKNKEALFVAVLEYEHDCFDEELAAAIDSGKTVIAKLTALALAWNQIRHKFIKMYKLTMDDFLNSPGTFMELRTRLFSKGVETTKSILRFEESLAGSPHLDEAARLFNNAIGPILHNIDGADDKRIRKDITLFCSIFYKGLKALIEEEG